MFKWQRLTLHLRNSSGAYQVHVAWWVYAELRRRLQWRPGPQCSRQTPAARRLRLPQANLWHRAAESGATCHGAGWMTSWNDPYTIIKSFTLVFLNSARGLYRTVTCVFCTSTVNMCGEWQLLGVVGINGFLEQRLKYDAFESRLWKRFRLWPSSTYSLETGKKGTTLNKFFTLNSKLQILVYKMMFLLKADKHDDICFEVGGSLTQAQKLNYLPRISKL